MNNIYDKRLLYELHPDIETKDLKSHIQTSNERKNKFENDKLRVKNHLKYISRLINLDFQKKIVVVGCGFQPNTIKALFDQGYKKVIGIEPVKEFVIEARKYLDDSKCVIEGQAEKMTLENNSQDLLLVESVMEHVDSEIDSLKEFYRILAPGGVALIYTTNKYKFNLKGKNGEYTLPFFNFLPSILKESYIHHQLHYNPKLANYTSRPAVHWFSYSELCKLGRKAGFARFYSIIDLVSKNDSNIKKSKLRTFFIDKIQKSPLLRSLYLIQNGGMIIMYKR